MGKSQNIAQMVQQNQSYQDYLQKLQDDLISKSKKYESDMKDSIEKYYKDNKWNKEDFISGKNADFMQESDWSLDNVQNIINAIASSIFGNGQTPDGVNITKGSDVSAAIGEMGSWETYIAGKCFEVLSGIIESFGSASSVQFSSSYKDEPLGNGLHLFVTVMCNSYKSKDFFDNQEIYEYLYLYEVKYSTGEAKQQADIALTQLYEDQIAAFISKSEDLIKKLQKNKITPEQYQTNNAIYSALIQAAKDALNQLEMVE
jgi:hypothetical protein